MTPLTALACLVVLQDGGTEVPPLSIGALVESEIRDSDARVHTRTIDAARTDAPLVGRPYRIDVPGAGTYRIEVSSYYFDAYLVLRDESGAVLAEDDDSGLGSDARIVCVFHQPGTYRVEACALHGDRGSFELRFERGDAPALSAEERRAAERSNLEQTLLIREQVHGSKHLATALASHNLGALLRAQGEYAAARPHFERALQIYEEVLGGEHLSTASSLNDLALLLQDQGDPAARAYLERALATFEKVLGPEHPWTATTINNLAVIVHRHGDFAAARELYERALAIREKTLGREHPLTALTLNTLASLFCAQGDYAAALPLYQRALAIREKAFGPEHLDTARSLNRLALLLVAQGEHEQAKALYERALAIRLKNLGPDHPETAAVLDNLGVLLSDRGDHAAARPVMERALAIFETALGPGHPETARSLSNLAVLLAAQGDYAAARSYGARALAIRESVFGSVHPDTIMSLRNLALVDADLGDSDSAWEHVSRAWKASRENQRRMLVSLSEAESYAFLATAHDGLDCLLSIARLAPSRAQAEYDAVLAWKGQVAREITASRERLLAELSDSEREFLEHLRSVKAELSKLAFEREITDRASHAVRLGELRALQNELELKLRRSRQGEGLDDVDYAALRASLPARSALLDFLVHRLYRPAEWDGEMLREPGAWQTPRVTVWITRHDRSEPVSLDLGPMTRVESVVHAFLAELVGARGRAPPLAADRTSAAEDLRRVVWEPIARELAEIDTIFVSPDGALAVLPFETLELDDRSFLVEHFRVAYVPDAAMLSRGRAERAPSLDSLLVAGGIDYRRRGELEMARGGAAIAATSNRATEVRGGFENHWAMLRHTAYEADVVASLHESAFEHGERVLLRGADATEERLKSNLSRHQVVHIATHGFFNPEGIPSLWEAALKEGYHVGTERDDEMHGLAGKHPGLLSGLVCAGANAAAEANRDDGYLTAEEVSWLDLSKVELVVLSACETGLGRPQSGEGLLGLRRAFEMAGAKTVISSLWTVTDESTSRLMQSFYENLWMRKMGRAAALRAAQLEMLAKNRAEHDDPLPSTWGAFVLNGEWR